LTLSDLQTRVRSCVRCAALVRCRTQPVPGTGAVPAVVMFVGIAPGRHGGDRTGMPFSGDRSGKLLREMIAHARLRGVFITNLVRCNPRDELGRNRDPDASEIANCRDHLRMELAIARPRVIACLGHMAWRELAGRGRPFTPTRPTTIQLSGAVLFPMYHPAYVNRGAYSIRRYRRDFRRLAQMIVKDGRAKEARPLPMSLRDDAKRMPSSQGNGFPPARAPLGTTQ
jgi:uracil-DNA glycosylase